MDMIDVLQKEDKDKIDALIEVVLEDYPNSPRAPVDVVLQSWSMHKPTLFKLFDNNLTLSKHVSVKISDEELSDKLCTALLGTPFMRHIMELIRDVQRTDNWESKWKNVLLTQKEKEGLRDYYGTESWDWRYKAEYLINSKLWAINKLDAATAGYRGSETYFCFPKPDGTAMKICFGTKMMKVLSRIAKEWGWEDDFEEFRLEHSRILNDDGLEGTLTLSIHPLDYLTASINDNNWQSCMNLYHGEYRRGVVEMMNSPYVVCAYLVTGKHRHISLNGDDTFWNNKKWRQFFIVAPDTGIFAIKGYPYWNRQLEKECLDWLKTLAETNLGISYDNNMICFEGDNGAMYANEGKIKGYLYTYAMYNDFCYEKHYGYLEPEVNRFSITYSSYATCLNCGEILDMEEFDGEGSLICDNCCPTIRCCSCDDRVNPDYVYYIDDLPFCEYCAQELPTCDYCGDSHLENNLSQYMLRDDQNNPHYYSISICQCCETYHIDTSSINIDNYDGFKIKSLPYNKIDNRFLRLLGYDKYDELLDDIKRVSLVSRRRAS